MIPPLTQWPADLLYEFHERAAIREFDGGQTREEAEAAAMQEVWERWMRGKTEAMF